MKIQGPVAPGANAEKKHGCCPKKLIHCLRDFMLPCCSLNEELENKVVLRAWPLGSVWTSHAIKHDIMPVLAQKHFA